MALESGAEAAENERDDALEKARLFTPRPAPAFRSLSDPALNEAATAVLTEAVEAYRWAAAFDAKVQMEQCFRVDHYGPKI